MLKALARYILREEAVKTQKQPKAEPVDCISRAEFESEMQKLRDRVEWDLSEWYDKFSTLHARTAKRAQRGQQQEVPVEQEQPKRPSVLAYRKPWSV